jgi:hypothetical protein
VRERHTATYRLLVPHTQWAVRDGDGETVRGTP